MTTTSTSATSPHRSVDAFQVLVASESKEAAVMRVALRQTAENGIDTLTVSGILTEAKVARGTVYAHFGDAVGVMATVWNHLGAAWLADIVDRPDTVLPKSLDRGLLEVLCVARREPQLMEVVQPDIEALWSGAERGGERVRLRTLWTLAAFIGRELLRPIRKDVSANTRMNELVSSLPDSAVRAPETPRSVAAPLSLAVLSPIHSTGDDITDRLMRASLDVVASAGYESASVLRIARAARLTPGAVAPRFNAINELHEMALLNAGREVVEMNVSQILPWVDKMHYADINALFIVPALDDVRRTWRRYRHEMLVAAHHDRQVARMLAKAFAAANETLRGHVASFAPEVAVHAVVFNEQFAIGLSALADLGFPIDRFDHRPVIRWIYDELVGG